MTRFVPVTVLVVVLAASGIASAQAMGGGTLPNNATITFSKLQVFDGGKFVETEATSQDRLHYFNLAHCNCAKANPDPSSNLGRFNYLIQETALSGKHVPVDFWVGSNCTDMTARNPTTGSCKLITSIPDIDLNLFPGGKYQKFSLFDVINGKTHESEECVQSDSLMAPIYAFVSTSGTPDTYDYMTSQIAGTLNGENATGGGIDTKPPPLPDKLSADPSDEGIKLRWTPPAANSTDIIGYQALCATTDGSPALSARTDAPEYVTTQEVCPGVTTPSSEAPSPTPLDNGEMAVTKPSGAFAALDAKYICGQQNGGTADSLLIKGLQNGTPYEVILLAVDLHGNFTATYFDHTITPVPATDFWEDLHDRGSKVEGGLCLLAETYGDDSFLTRTLRAFRDDTLGASRAGRWLSDAYYATMGKLGAYVHGSVVLRLVAAVVLAPLVMLALLWHWVTLPGLLAAILLAWLWRRRRNLPRRAVRVVAATGAIAMIALLPGRAHAGGYEPYWENNDDLSAQNEAAASEPSLVTWHVGVRVGPYVPQIDNGFDTTAMPGPYKQMFGGAQVLPMLDIDRIVWTGFGQVGVGGSVGYMQKSRDQFADQTSASDAMRDRSHGNTNTFRLLPIALTATYRFTWLDDEYGIPVVPYVRGGLSYYLWWLTVTDGSLARVCKDGGTEPMCSQNKALGASLGVQGSIGLAIRAERVDATAAMSMRQSGIQHAGIYGELSLAKVDGFGSDTKLSVGDRTWFAGVDFEF